MNYDIIVVGGGHAGCEAAHATSYKKYKTLLITSNINNIADMPCNPSIGGTAKGIVVREIDALGGIMGRVADESHFQLKMLNNAKGVAVRSLRAQADKILYPKNILKELKKNSSLDIIENMVKDLIVENNEVKGVILENNQQVFAKIVILTTGTYLKAQRLIGKEITKGGPHGEKESKYLSDNLKKYGFDIQRLKTGTPPRIGENSVDFTILKEELGDKKCYYFSFDNNKEYDPNKQKPCYLLYTNQKTHQIINQNLKESSMYSGIVEGIGPRYCPSIEDKIVRFSNKERHQLFLEPESNETNEWYLQGLSTSMPEKIQDQLVHSINGLENAKITKYGYAIEYDALNPLQIKPSLETKILKNLYTAGQINGTSGYEEAAAAGLMAGINATLALENKEALILKRNEAYIGVLIDDLVTKGTKEPYRLLTSRAEYRLLLRHDNADLRLREYGYKVGLINKSQYQKLQQKITNINILKNQLQNIKQNNKTLLELLKRPEINFATLKEKYNFKTNASLEEMEQLEIETKYEGYINKAYKEAEKMLKLEKKQIPEDIDYNQIKNLASEALQKLNLIRPKSLGQALRISGVNPADISILAVYLKKEYPNYE